MNEVIEATAKEPTHRDSLVGSYSELITRMRGVQGQLAARFPKQPTSVMDALVEVCTKLEQMRYSLSRAIRMAQNVDKLNATAKQHKGDLEMLRRLQRRRPKPYVAALVYAEAFYYACHRACKVMELIPLLKKDVDKWYGSSGVCLVRNQMFEHPDTWSARHLFLFSVGGPRVVRIVRHRDSPDQKSTVHRSRRLAPGMDQGLRANAAEFVDWLGRALTANGVGSASQIIRQHRKDMARRRAIFARSRRNASARGDSWAN